MRRIGLALLVLLGLLIVVPIIVNWSVQTDRIDTSLYTSDIGCSDREALWLMAQAVPSASLVPCAQLLPAAWALNDIKVREGEARITFDIERPFQQEAVAVQLAPSCDLAGAVEVSSEQPGARRYIRIDRSATPPAVTRSYVFPGGCITERRSRRWTSPRPATPTRPPGSASGPGSGTPTPTSCSGRPKSPASGNPDAEAPISCPRAARPWAAGGGGN